MSEEPNNTTTMETDKHTPDLRATLRKLEIYEGIVKNLRNNVFSTERAHDDPAKKCADAIRELQAEHDVMSYE